MVKEVENVGNIYSDFLFIVYFYYILSILSLYAHNQEYQLKISHLKSFEVNISQYKSIQVIDNCDLKLLKIH